MMMLLLLVSGIFDRVEHVILVGCGGAVPDFHDYNKHVRLGDIVVATPSATSNGKGPLYVHCEKFEQKQGKFNYQKKDYTCR